MKYEIVTSDDGTILGRYNSWETGGYVARTYRFRCYKAVDTEQEAKDWIKQTWE